MTSSNMTYAEAYKYGTLSPNDLEALLDHHSALERIHDVWFDVDESLEKDDAEALDHHLRTIRNIFQEFGL